MLKCTRTDPAATRAGHRRAHLPSAGLGATGKLVAQAKVGATGKLAAILGLAIAALAGCFSPDCVEWTHPGFDASASHRYPATRSVPDSTPDSWPIPAPAAEDGNRPSGVFVCDVRGDSAPEIVVVYESRLQVSALSGRGRAVWNLPRGMNRLGLARDVDGDHKADIILGSDHRIKPAVCAVNASGITVYRVAAGGKRADYLEVLPFSMREGSLFAVARARYADSPRGLLALSIPNHEIIWDFAVPFDPISAIERDTGGNAREFAVSQRLTFQGSFPFLGTERETVYGVDAALHSVAVDASGELLHCLPVTRNGSTLIGDGRFYALPPCAGDRLLLLREIDAGKAYGNAEYSASLHIVEGARGRVAHTYPVPPGRRFQGLRKIPTEAGYRVAVLLRDKNERHYMVMLDSSLSPVVSRELPVGSVCLGPVLAYQNPAATRLIVVADATVYALDANLEGAPIARTQPPTEDSPPSHRPAAAAYVEWAGCAYLVSAGHDIRVCKW